MAQRFGRYWLQEKIGHGGMAEIFRATIGPDAATYAFELAIKRLHAELETDPKHVGMFLTEAEIAKFLRHPNLVSVYEAGIIESHVYIAMEYIWGYDLARLIEQLRRRRLRLPAELAVYITLQALRGLDYVHQAKNARGEPMEIVHRDVTPSNIYVTYRGEVKLGDFGIARVKVRDGGEESRVLKGKVHYMPPEVLAGEPVGPMVDLWSLSVSLYEMLTARPLYEGVTEADMVAGNYVKAIPPVHKVNSAVPVELSKILARALHVKPSKRPPTATLLYRELKQFLATHQLAADAASLARFIRGGAGMPAGSTEPNSQIATDDFANPEYLAPIEFSPTQRYELTRRRNPWLRPMLLAVPVALGVAAAVGYSLAPGHRRGAALDATRNIDESLDSEMLADMDDASQQRFRTLIQRGVTQLKRGSYDSAAEAFRQAADLRPRSSAAQLGWARAHYELANYAEAERLVAKVLQEDPKNIRAYFLLGGILRAHGQPARAKKAFQQCVALDPQGPFGKSAQQMLTAGN